jgi:hypothetical protein
MGSKQWMQWIIRFLPWWVAAFVLGGCASRPDDSIVAAKDSVAVAPRVAEAVPVKPRDAYVLLSGGGTPLSNNYSQYLQAKAVAEFFGRMAPPESTWVFFGVGNREGAPPILADARHELKREGVLVQSWVPGVLPRNRPATRDGFLRALRDEILPTVRGGGTLYLFVGDHGELAGEKENQESAVTMWQLKPGRRRDSAWRTDDKEILTVSELRQTLAAGIGQGRVVFCMTQCHSGGFHELGVAVEMTPPRAWFSAVPAWAAGSSPGVRLRAAGFTATDEESLAAGCDADPDPERWAGYERFLPETLFGIDLMSGQPKHGATRSFAEAHEIATLVDQTIDKPRATSEHYLEAWARLIETKLATTLAVTPKTHAAVAAFQQAVDTGRLAARPTDGGLRERQAQFARFTQRLTEQAPAAQELLVSGTRQQLDAAVRARGERGGGGGGRGRRGQMAELRKAWTETLRPAWKVAVLGGKVDQLTGAALAFEKHLLKLEDGGRDFLLPRGETPLMNEIYWNSGHDEPAKFDPRKADAVALWGATRRTQIVTWGKRATDPQVRAAAEKIGPGPVFTEEPPATLTRKTAAERVLFYRRVLAAWEFLIAMDAQPALAELRALIELEQTPLKVAIRP